MPTRVMLIDDHLVVLEGLKGLLAAEPDIQIVGEARNGHEGIELAAKILPDVIVLDVTMPGLNGIETMREIRRRCPETEVLGLSMHTSDQVVCDMLSAGASGYMLKSSSAEQLAGAIRTVMTGQTFLSPEIADFVPRELLRGGGGGGGREPEHAELTAREREVLKLVAEGRSSKEIGEALYVTTKTVVFHRQSIMDKLELRSVAELTKYAVRMGMTST